MSGAWVVQDDSDPYMVVLGSHVQSEPAWLRLNHTLPDRAKLCMLCSVSLLRRSWVANTGEESNLGECKSWLPADITMAQSCGVELQSSAHPHHSPDMPQSEILQKARRATRPGVSLSVALLQILRLGHV